MVKNLPSMQEKKLWSLGQDDPLEKGMAIHSSILAWRIIMVKGVWWATVHGFTKSRTRLSFYYIRVYLDSFLKKWDSCNPLQEDFFQFTFWFRSPSPMLIFYFSPLYLQFSSVAQSYATLQPHESQHFRPPCPSPTPGVHPDSCPSGRWCHPAISSSVVPFSSCP